MKIKDVRVAVVATGPWPTQVPSDYEWLLVRVDTDEGLFGIGETRSGPGIERAIEQAKARLIGEDPTNINGIQQLLGPPERSGIDIACWDLAGKALGVPLYRLLGGKYRDKIRMYADSGGPVGWGLGSADPEVFANRAKSVLKRGFAAMKVDVDMPAHGQPGFTGNVEEHEVALMWSQVKAVRDVIGDEMLLAVDCHGKYNPAAAVKIARRLQGFELWWLEDPVTFCDVEALVEVRTHTHVPISAGEVLQTRFDFRELLERDAVSILGPDSITTGGLTEFRKTCELADVYHIPVAPHNMTTPVATVATAHVCAALPNFVALEHHFQDFAWWSHLVKGDPVVKNGCIELPERPGIGLELDEQELSKHLKRGNLLT